MDVDIELGFEEDCWHCNGTGKYNKKKCDECAGEGTEISPLGDILLDFISKHKGKIKELLKE